MAKPKQEEGQKELAAFAVSHSTKSLNDLVKNTWKMNTAKSTIKREKKTRMDIIKKCSEEKCIETCAGER